MEVAPAVSLRIVSCERAFVRTLQRLLALELASREAGERLGVQVSCRADQAHIIAIERTSKRTPRGLTRTVFDSDLARSAWARLVAIAAAELVAALDRADHALAQRGRQHAGVRAPRDNPRGLRVHAATRLGWMTRPSRLTGGGSVGLSHQLSRGWGWRLELAADHGHHRSMLGETSAFLLSAAVALTAHWHLHERFHLTGGLGARIGAVRFAGSSADRDAVIGRAVWDAWLGPMTLLELELGPLWRQLSVLALAETGYPAIGSGATSGSQRTWALDSLWITTSLGVAWRW
jgi:hypothetical protein